MTIKIEVTADNLAELADKLAALSSRFNPYTGTSSPADIPEKPKRTTKPKAEAPAENTPEEPAVTDEAKSTADTPAAALDFDKDVAPLVIALVGKKGKPAVSAILGQFGAARASEVDEAQWPELIALLKEE